MTTYHLIRPPNRYIWWEHIQENPPDLSKFCQKPQTVTRLFAAFLFFDSFPLNPPLFERGFKGRLSTFIARSCFHSIAELKFSKISASLLKFAYAPRAPPLLTFGFKQISEVGGATRWPERIQNKQISGRVGCQNGTTIRSGIKTDIPLHTLSLSRARI